MHKVCMLKLVILALLLPLSEADAADLPERRPGLWEVQTVTEKPAQGARISAKMCIDRSTDREMLEFGLQMSRESCARYEVTGAGNAWTIASQCSFGSMKSTTRTTISGDFQSRVSVRIEGSVEGAPGASGMQDIVVTQEARWIGSDCPGMMPGDVMLDGGFKMNIKQMQQLKKLLPQLQIR